MILRRALKRLRRPFLTGDEKQSISAAIRAAESRTSAEIRVHVLALCPGDALYRARTVFARLGLHHTKRRNAVLILVSHLDHKLAIWGDSGIHALAGQELWDREREALAEDFRENRYAEGLVASVGRIGARLAEFFPPEPGDANELPDEPTHG